MKKAISLILSLAILCLMAIPATAAVEPVITQQPQNPTHNEYSTAQYSVTVYGNNLKCTWYLGFEGKEYNISDTDNGIEPWEGFAGETYGANKTINGNSTTFTLTVEAKNKPKAELLQAPNKVVYVQGERLDLTGLKVRVYHSDGTYFDSLNGDKLTITTQPLKTLGEQKIKLSYGEAFDFFIVTVKDASTAGTTVSEPSAASGSGHAAGAESQTPSAEETVPEGEESSSTGGTQISATPPAGNNDDKTDASKPGTPSEENGTAQVETAGMPLWGIVLIAAAAAGAGVSVTLIVLKKKK